MSTNSGSTMIIQSINQSPKSLKTFLPATLGRRISASSFAMAAADACCLIDPNEVAVRISRLGFLGEQKTNPKDQLSMTSEPRRDETTPARILIQPTKKIVRLLKDFFQ